MTLLEVKNLSFAYGEKQVLSDITLQVHKGEILGVIGPNGSGKTTLLRLMSGVLPYSKGKVLLKGNPLTSYNKKNLAKLTAFVEQDGAHILSFTVEEIVAMGRYPWLKPFNKPSSKDLALIEESLKKLDIYELRNKPVFALSGGERQLVSIARAMVQEPAILFLDEPTTFLDIGHQQQVMQHIRKWQQENDLTVIMVIHDLNLAALYCKRLLLMEQSKVKMSGTVHEVLNENNLDHVYHTKTIIVEHPVTKVPQILLEG